MCVASTSASLRLHCRVRSPAAGGAIVSVDPVETMIARSTVLRSSRMLPGHDYRCSDSMHSLGTVVTVLPMLIEHFSMNAQTRAGMSSIRSRSGGTVIGKTLSR